VYVYTALGHMLSGFALFRAHQRAGYQVSDAVLGACGQLRAELGPVPVCLCQKFLRVQYTAPAIRAYRGSIMLV